MGPAAMERLALSGPTLMRLLILFLSLLLSSQADDRPALIVVVGAEGAPEYGREFATWADRWARSAERGSMRLVQIGREPQSAEAADKNNGPTDKQKLQAAIEAES